jgi:hypothetical protein
MKAGKRLKFKFSSMRQAHKFIDENADLSNEEKVKIYNECKPLAAFEDVPKWGEFAKKLGFINQDGSPAMCHHCGHENFENTHHYECCYIVETDVSCKKCGRSVALWSYGVWFL